MLSVRALKVAEHSFQEPMLNHPLLLNYLCFGARLFFLARVKVIEGHSKKRIFFFVIINKKLVLS